MDSKNTTKVALLGLHLDDNYGDPCIAETVKYIYSKLIPTETDWLCIDLRKFCTLDNKHNISDFHYKIIKKISNYATRKNRGWLGECVIKYLARIFYRQLDGVNLGILAGGGTIHYRVHDYWIGISAFIKACDRRNIPVIINGVGVEDYDEHNPKCRVFSKYLQWKNVKAAITRDDLDGLKSYFGQRNIYVTKAIDPVIFGADAFNMEPSHNREKFGIGIIRTNIFDDYKTSGDIETVVNYICGLTRELEKRGYKYDFISNGASCDDSMIPLIEKQLGRTITVRKPKSSSELVKMISTYKGLFTTRMHTGIIAYSLGIPVVGLIWLEKIYYWGQNIKSEKFFMWPKELSPEKSINLMEEALEQGYDENLRIKLRSEHLNVVRNALSAAFAK